MYVATCILKLCIQFSIHISQWKIGTEQLLRARTQTRDKVNVFDIYANAQQH